MSAGNAFLALTLEKPYSGLRELCKYYSSHAPAWGFIQQRFGGVA
ncbi:MAG: hypothetical protein Q7T40_13365 [Methylobacter sp.]|nr:hypothetical protein [Methylobacter sp.]